MKKIVIFVTLILALLMCMASCDSLPSFGSKSEDAPALDSKPEHTHEFGEWFTTEEPTCASNGVKARYCSCGEKQNETIPKLTHNVVIDASVAPTCTETGLTEGKHCSVCNEILVMQLEIQKDAHSYDNANDAECNVCGFVRNVECTHELVEVRLAKPATCTQSGLTQGRVCVDCEEVLVEQTVIDPLGHTEVVDDAVAPTCSTTGLTEGKHCSVCNEVLTSQEIVPTLAHSVLFGTSTCSVCGVEVISEGLSYTLSSDETYYIVSGIGTCTDTNIIIPSSYNGLPVKEIDTSAFEYCSSLTSVTIGNGVTIIGYTAFADCTNLTSVVIPDSVTSIRTAAFEYCSSLTSVVIPDSVTSIMHAAFADCTNLTSVTLDSGCAASIGEDTFDNCNSALYTEYEYGRYVGNSDNPYQILIGLTNKNFNTYTIHEDTQIIAGRVFDSCERLTSITIPDSVTSIGDWAFRDCSSLTSVVIPDSVTSIGYNAFSSCDSLTSVVIGNGVTSIGESAFYYCSNLKAVYISDIAAWCNISFEYSPLLGGYSSNPMYYAENLYLNGEVITELVIPDGVTTITASAFYNVDSLTSVVIPDSVTSIGSSAFSGCTSLKDVFYTGSEEDWAKISIGSSNSYLTKATKHYNYVAA